MANEITLNASISVEKEGVTFEGNVDGASFTNLQFNMSGEGTAQGSLDVATSPTLIPMGTVTAPHWAVFENTDDTNYVTIRNGSGGADVCRFYPGEGCPVPLDPTGTYYAVANTAAVRLLYKIYDR